MMKILTDSIIYFLILSLLPFDLTNMVASMTAFYAIG